MTHAIQLRRWLSGAACAAIFMFALTCHAQDSAITNAAVSINIDSSSDAAYHIHSDKRFRYRRHHNGNAIVSVGHDSHLAADQSADSVVSILGSSTAEGDVADAVVSILGNTRVTGTVGDAAVAVFGSTYVNGRVQGDVVAVLGNIELGPEAQVEGDVVAVGGTTKRDPQAIVQGSLENVNFGVAFGEFTGLHAWFEKGLLYGRPLALDERVLWAWIVAASLLSLYVLFALLFRDGIDKCAQTFAEHPGQSVLTAIAAALLSPIVIILLCITVIGIPVVPFLGMALIGAALFGKAAILAWLGQKMLNPMRGGSRSHPALAVLVGGVVVTFLYLVPVLGFIIFNVLGVLGFGAAMYTAILALRGTRSPQIPPSPAATSEPIDPTPEPTMNSASTAQTSETQTPPPAPPVISATLPRAGFWLRMGALLIDLVITGIVLSAVHHGGHFHLLVLATYGAVMWKLKRTTIGGIVCGIALVRVDEHEIDWATAIVRALACFLSLVVAGLGFLWIAFDENKQAWHDKIAGTVVVRVPKGISLL